MREGTPINEKGTLGEPYWIHTCPCCCDDKGNLSFVRLSLSESKVLRLIQLMEAPVSYSAFIFTFLQLIGKTVPVEGPTAIVQVSTKWVSVLFTSL